MLFNELKKELLVHIMRYCSTVDILSLSEVGSYAIYDASREESLWRAKCIDEFQVARDAPRPPTKRCRTWLQQYIKLKPKPNRGKGYSKDGYCPRCGSLVVRKNTHYSRGYEVFYGCDSWPACRFTQDRPPPPVQIQQLEPRTKRRRQEPKTLEQLDLFGIKAELRKRKLSTRGRKAQLLARLEEAVDPDEKF